jgi:hypothetical protein
MIKVTEDNFVWKVLTEGQAKFIFISGLFDLYVLYVDESETLIEDIKEIEKAVIEGAELGIEVGFYQKK